MQLFTSNYASLKRISSAYTPISISIGKPFWYKGLSYNALAPTWKMIEEAKNGNRGYYDREYAKILANLDPRKVMEQLQAMSIKGFPPAMLCWCKADTERHPEPCHRFLVKRWIIESLDIEITEA